VSSGATKDSACLRYGHVGLKAEGIWGLMSGDLLEVV
jgi:hypothetical protein